MDADAIAAGGGHETTSRVCRRHHVGHRDVNRSSGTFLIRASRQTNRPGGSARRPVHSPPAAHKEDRAPSIEITPPPEAGGAPTGRIEDGVIGRAQATLRPVELHSVESEQARSLEQLSSLLRSARPPPCPRRRNAGVSSELTFVHTEAFHPSRRDKVLRCTKCRHSPMSAIERSCRPRLDGAGPGRAKSPSPRGK